mmetsp:Transcript_4293/g.8512  ORF Transcript_4293/g.8512 Transcript_4293/m.8512 type:complete len:95 (-) Transcript_4293:13-297(-)
MHARKLYLFSLLPCPIQRLKWDVFFLNYDAKPLRLRSWLILSGIIEKLVGEIHWRMLKFLVGQWATLKGCITTMDLSLPNSSSGICRFYKQFLI